MSLPEVLRIRPFRDLWLGQAISQVGDALYYVSFMFMIKKITGSAAMVGYTGALEALPFILVMPFSGVLADRIDRKCIMLASDMFSAVALLAFGIPILVGVRPAAWAILLLAFLLSSIRCFFMPAKSAAIPALVPTDKVLAANAVSTMTFSVMQIAGLAFSAAALAPLYLLSQKGFFFGTVAINALSFLGSAFFIARLPAIMPDRTNTHEVHPMTDFRDGIKFVWKRHDLSALILLLIVFRLAIAPFFVAYIVANDQWWGGPLHQGKPATLALVELSFFCGWMISISLTSRAKVLRPTLWFCWGMTAVGLMIVGMAFSEKLWLFGLFNFLCGLSIAPADLPINTYIQLSVEDAFRGRTGAAINMVSSVAAPLGWALGGVLIARFGLVALFIGIGAGLVLSALIGFVDPGFRDVRMPDGAVVAAEPVELFVGQEV